MTDVSATVQQHERLTRIGLGGAPVQDPFLAALLDRAAGSDVHAPESEAMDVLPDWLEQGGAQRGLQENGTEQVRGS